MSLRHRSTSPRAPLHLRRDASPQPLERLLPRVRTRPNETFYTEIQSGEERIGLGTFETAHEAARAYDAVAWCLGHSRRSMNFSDVWTRQQGEALAPPPPTVMREARQQQRELEQRLVIVERDKRMRLEWARCFSEAVAVEVAFYAGEGKSSTRENELLV
jgi:hypothetical protein